MRRLQTACGGSWVVDWSLRKAYRKDNPREESGFFGCQSPRSLASGYYTENVPIWQHPDRIPECVRRIVRGRCYGNVMDFPPLSTFMAASRRPRRKVR